MTLPSASLVLALAVMFDTRIIRGTLVGLFRRSARVLFAPPRRVRVLGASNDVLRRGAKTHVHALMSPISGLGRGQT
jgi:hypothetical protein